MRYSFYLATVALVLAGFVLARLYLNGIITLSLLNADMSIELSLFFPFVVFSYLLAKGQSLKTIIKGLGLSKGKITALNIFLGGALFVSVLIIEFLIGGISQITGIPLPTNVQRVLAGLPFYFLVFTFVVAPFDEEVLFRGFLVPRVGIVISAFLFAIPHLLSYSSVSEFVAAFAFGLIAGYVFKRYRSLYTTIIAHALVNLLTIIAILPL